ncbi:hypothetical protein D3C80_1212060 [compost metagenome]
MFGQRLDNAGDDVQATEHSGDQGPLVHGLFPRFDRGRPSQHVVMTQPLQGELNKVRVSKEVLENMQGLTEMAHAGWRHAFFFSGLELFFHVRERSPHVPLHRALAHD